MYKNKIMKHLLVICIFFFSILNALARGEKKSLITNSRMTFSVGELSILDEYIAPITFKGKRYKIENVRLKPLSFNPEKWSRYLKLNASYARLIPESNTSAEMNVTFNFAEGMHYNYRLSDKFKILAGGFIDLDTYVRYFSQNSNNPVNFDVSLNLNASIICFYKFKLWNHDFGLEGYADSPLIGYMFCPYLGSPYYEIYSEGNYFDNMNVTSFYNKNVLKYGLNFDIPLDFTTLSLGVSGLYYKSEVRDVYYKYSNFNINIGFVLDFMTLKRSQKDKYSNLKVIYK